MGQVLGIALREGRTFIVCMIVLGRTTTLAAGTTGLTDTAANVCLGFNRNWGFQPNRSVAGYPCIGQGKHQVAHELEEVKQIRTSPQRRVTGNILTLQAPLITPVMGEFLAAMGTGHLQFPRLLNRLQEARTENAGGQGEEADADDGHHRAE